MKFTLPRSTIQANETEETYSDLLIRRSEAAGKAFVKIWRGKASRPFAFYSFRSAEQREAYVTEQKSWADARSARKEEDRKARAGFKHSLVVGDILYSTWGYDQTNADFYQVTDVRGKIVVIREIAAPLVNGEEGFMQGRRAAIKDEFTGEPMRRLVTIGNGVSISSYEIAHKWDGHPVSVSWYA